jgi:hypothetical protein
VTTGRLTSLFLASSRKEASSLYGPYLAYFFFHMSQNSLTVPGPCPGVMPSAYSKSTIADDFCRECFSPVKMRYEAPAFSKS